MTARNQTRTRFAPSPTGHLHIGNARTALFNWLFAKHHSGSFILRIEDTDLKRSERSYESSIIDDLKWLGLEWDEGPDISGPSNHYRQSERVDIYKEYAERLLDSGSAYLCYCTVERLRELREKQLSNGIPPRYDGRCRALREMERPKDVKPVIRFAVPEKEVSFIDGVHESLSFDASTFGDFIIVGSNMVATYNFAVVIDDALMKITHVIRGEDHLSNTPRQILLYEALDMDIPLYAHLPLILGPDKTPLSKRHGMASIKNLREDGFLRDGIINHLCHLGWSPDKRLLSIQEAVDKFTMKRLSRSPSIFDIAALKRLNRDYLEQTDTDTLVKMTRLHLKKDLPYAWLKDAIRAVRGDARTIKDIALLLEPFLGEPVYNEDAIKVLEENHVKMLLTALFEEVEKKEKLSVDSYKDIVNNLREVTGKNGKQLLMPIRAALTGRLRGIELENIFVLLGKKKVIERLKRYITGCTP